MPPSRNYHSVPVVQQQLEHRLNLSIVAILLASALSLGKRTLFSDFSWIDWGEQVFFILSVGLMSDWLMEFVKKNRFLILDPFMGGLHLCIIILCTTLVSLSIALPLPALIKPVFYNTAHTHYVLEQWLVRNALIAAIIGGIILRYQHVSEALHLHQKTGLQARIQALQSRIRPHFLFNCMNLIASLIPDAPDKAERAVVGLSRLFRATLHEACEVSLDEEISLCQDYLNIESLRLGERLQVQWNMETVDSSLPIPLLTLQPILENAVYYGIEPLQEPGLIQIYLRYHHHVFSAEIRNPLPHPSATASIAHGHQLALANIHERLCAYYGERAKLKTSKDRNIFTTYLSYPIVLRRSL